MIDGILWFVTNLGMAFVNLATALANPSAWLDWSQPQSLANFIYYGASTQFFFVIVVCVTLLTIAGLVWRPVMWGVVRGLEGVANGLGRFAAWFGLLMVLQQIMIVFLQRIFRVSSIEVGPFGLTFARDLSWWSEELKLFNAIVVVLCVSYTFVQGGHVRVDLMYSQVSYRTKRVIDMLGALFFMIPVATITWLYAWFFMWRHLVTPKLSASESLAQISRKSQLFKWNVETIGPSPNGFDAYFLFKILIVAFAGMVFVHAIAVLYRSILEYREGPESEGRYLDRDVMTDNDATKAH